MAADKQVTINAKKGKNAVFSKLAVTDGGFVMGNPGLAIDTNFDVQAVNAFDIVFGGKLYTVAAGADFDTGTVKDITIDYFASALLSVDTDGTPYLQWAAEATTAARAVDALDAITPTGDVVVGYVTVQTKAGVNWKAGTDALTGGTGGDVALSTTYVQVFGWVK
jgi:hypothetical protein